MNNKVAIKVLCRALRNREFENALRTVRLTLGIQKSNLNRK